LKRRPKYMLRSPKYIIQYLQNICCRSIICKQFCNGSLNSLHLLTPPTCTLQLIPSRRPTLHTTTNVSINSSAPPETSDTLSAVTNWGRGQHCKTQGTMGQHIYTLKYQNYSHNPLVPAVSMLITFPYTEHQ